jgi:broad specificity phosphatase PhoE
MTRILLIHAGPTPWDQEDRVVGNNPLPLADEARALIEQIVKSLPHAVSAIYRFKKNEACEQAARIAAETLKLRLHENGSLNELNLGLWQGLTRAELRFRFPTAFPQWEENPMAVNPPEGETVMEATDRLRGGLKRILRRNRGVAVLLSVRPMALQILLGIVRLERPETIASHLQTIAPIETIDVPDDQLYQFI